MSDSEPLVPALEQLRALVPDLQRAIGRHSAVALHTLTESGPGLLASAPGTANAGEPGFPSPDGESTLNVARELPDGRIVRSSTIVIRDEGEDPVACLCISLDIAPLEIARNAAAARLPRVAQGKRDGDAVMASVRMAVSEILGQRSVRNLDRAERISLVGDLDRSGVFMLRGAPAAVAAVIGVSRFTVYKYLDTARSAES